MSVTHSEAMHISTSQKYGSIKRMEGDSVVSIFLILRGREFESM